MTESINKGNNDRGDKPSFISLLIQKLAFVKQIASQTGISTSAAQNEVLRQMGQVSTSQGGDNITGEGVTKSGSEDAST